MVAADFLCGCQGAGSNGVDPTDYTADQQTEFEMITPDDLIDVPEQTWEPGSVARLVAPFPVNAGQWEADQMVSQFVKTQDGRWLSSPGANIHYPDLVALALATPIEFVENAQVARVIDVEVISPVEPLPSAPIDLGRIAIEGQGVQFDTETGVEQNALLNHSAVKKGKTIASDYTPSEIVKKIPWWVWLVGGGLGLYAITRK